MRIKFITHSVLAMLTPLVLNGQEVKPATITPPTSEATEAESEQAKTEKKLEIVKVSEDIFDLGEIRINKKTREITFPATVEITGIPDAKNQTIVEYVLVNPEGKIHESLFLTEIKPSHLNVAFKLLGYKESKHLFRVVNKNFQPQEEYEKATPEQIKESRFDMVIKWKGSDGKVVSHNINELIHNAETDKPMEAGPWVYGGSFIYQGKYVADLNKDLFAIFTDRGSIGNYAGEGREDDTLWFPNSKVMPPMGTKTTFHLTPFVEKAEKK